MSKSVVQNISIPPIDDQGRPAAVTVGEGGRYTTIIEAITKLQDEQEISLYMLPGTHALTGQNAILDREVIKIVGSGGLTSIIKISSSGISLSAGEILIRDVGFQVTSVAGSIDLAAERVTAEGCIFERRKGRKDAPPLVVVGPKDDAGTAEVRWFNNRMAAVWSEKKIERSLSDVLLPDIPEMRAELVDFIGKLNLLEDTNPYADELAFADKVAEVVASVSELPPDIRTKWSGDRPLEIIDNLPEDLTSISPFALRSNPRLMVCPSSKVSLKDAAIHFYDLVGEVKLNPGELSIELARVFRTLFESGYGDALALNTKCGGTIQNNFINGNVSFMHDLVGSFVSSEISINIANMVKESADIDLAKLLDLGPSIKFHSNEVNLVCTKMPEPGTNGEIERIYGFKSVVVSDNAFKMADGNGVTSVVGGLLSMCGNWFPTADKGDIAAIVLGNSGVFIGNHAKDPGASINYLLKEKNDDANLIELVNLEQ